MSDFSEKFNIEVPPIKLELDKASVQNTKKALTDALVSPLETFKTKFNNLVTKKSNLSNSLKQTKKELQQYVTRQQDYETLGWKDFAKKYDPSHKVLDPYSDVSESSWLGANTRNIDKYTNQLNEQKEALQQIRQEEINLLKSNINKDTKLPEETRLKVENELNTILNSRKVYNEQQIKDAEELLSIIKQQAEESKKVGGASSTGGATTSTDGTTTKLKTASDTTKKMQTRVSSLGKSFGGLTKHTRNFSNSFGKGLKKGLKNLLVVGLGARSIYMAIRMIRTEFVKAMNTMAVQIPEINKQFSETKTLFTGLKASLGTMAQPIVSSLLPAINWLITKLTDLAILLAKVFATLRGQDYIYRATTAWQDYADSIDGANDKLGAYDKLNVIQQDSGNNNTLSGVTYKKEDFEKTGILAFIDKVRTKILELWEKLKEFWVVLKDVWNQMTPAEKIAVVALGILSLIATIVALSGAFGGLKTDVASVVSPATAVAGFFEKLLTFAGIIGIIYALSDSLESITGLLTAFAESGKTVWEVLGLLATVFGSIILTVVALTLVLQHHVVGALSLVAVLVSISLVIDSLTKLLDTFTASGITVESLITLIVVGCVAFITTIGIATLAVTTIITTVQTFLLTLGALVLALSTNVVGALLFIATLVVVGATISAIIEAIAKLGEAIADIIESIAKLGDAIAKIIEAVDGLISGALQGIADVINATTNLLNTVDSKGVAIIATMVLIGAAIVDLIGDVKDLAQTVNDKCTSMKNTIKNTWSSVQTTLSSGVTKLKSSILNPLVTFIKNNVFNKIGSNFSNLKTSFKTTLNVMLSYVQTFANAVVTAFNKVIDSINSIGLSVPSWVPEYGGKSWYPSLNSIGSVSIPRLAQGAVIPPNKEFMAVLGDQSSGTNIEAPLDTIKQALAEVMSIYGGNTQPIVLQLDGKTVAKVVWDENKKRYKQTGKNYAY